MDVGKYQFGLGLGLAVSDTKMLKCQCLKQDRIVFLMHVKEIWRSGIEGSFKMTEDFLLFCCSIILNTGLSSSWSRLAA